MLVDHWRPTCWLCGHLRGSRYNPPNSPNCPASDYFIAWLGIPKRALTDKTCCFKHERLEPAELWTQTLPLLQRHVSGALIDSSAHEQEKRLRSGLAHIQGILLLRAARSIKTNHNRKLSKCHFKIKYRWNMGTKEYECMAILSYFFYLFECVSILFCSESILISHCYCLCCFVLSE